MSLCVHEFIALGTVGLTNRLDLSVILPFSRVTLATAASLHAYNVDSANTLLSDYDVGTVFLAGSATGIGDVAVNVKANALKGEHTHLAIGSELRFPTGDEANYLGTGAYGVKPYIVVSRRGRLTPNLSLGYQWNSTS